MKSSYQSNPFTNAEPLMVPIVEAYPEELQPVHSEKKQLNFSTKNNSAVTPIKREIVKNENWENRIEYTLEAHPRVIQEMEETTKNYIRVKRTSTHKHNTRSSIKRVNHVTTTKNYPIYSKWT